MKFEMQPVFVLPEGRLRAPQSWRFQALANFLLSQALPRARSLRHSRPTVFYVPGDAISLDMADTLPVGSVISVDGYEMECVGVFGTSFYTWRGSHGTSTIRGNASCTVLLVGPPPVSPREFRAVCVTGELAPGDIVRHRGGADAYVVTANYGDRVTAVRTVDITNPCEWLVLRGST